MNKDIETVALVFMQTSLHSWEVVKVFKNTGEAIEYCKEQNAINKPQFDDYGYYEGTYMFHAEMKVE